MERLGVARVPPEYLEKSLRLTVVVTEFIVRCQETEVAAGVPDTMQVTVALSPTYTVDPEPVVTAGTPACSYRIKSSYVDCIQVSLMYSFFLNKM